MGWIEEHWFELLQTIGIVGGLAFTAAARIQDVRARKVGNLIALKQEHREIWKELYARPSLSRVLKQEVDLGAEPISIEEALFVKTLILHLGTVHQATEMGLFVNLEGLRTDVSAFFSKAIPGSIWEKTKKLQNQD